MKERLKWVDCLRMFAIFSIYLYHFGDASGKAYLFTNLYHIKLFFFISGFFFTEIITAEELGKRLIKIVYRVAIPTFLYIVINIAFLFVVNKYSIEQALPIIKAFLAMKKGSGIGGLWFLGCFLFMSVFHCFVSYLVKNKYVVFLLSLFLVLYVHFANPFNFEGHLIASADLIPQYWIYYSLGSIVFPILNKMETSNSKRTEMLRLGLLALSGIYTVFCYASERFVVFGNIPLYGFWGAIILFLFFTIISQYIAKLLNERSIILEIGKATFVLCATEIMTRRIITGIFSVVGVEFEASSTITAVLLTLLYLLFGFFLWFKCIASIFPILNGHYSPKRNLKHTIQDS